MAPQGDPVTASTGGPLSRVAACAPAPAGPTRRVLLTGTTALTLAGLPLLLTACKGVQALGTPPPPARDVRVLRAAIDAERLLLSRCATAAAQLGHPAAGHTPAQAALLGAVTTVQSDHSAHLAQLRSRLLEPAGVGPTPTPEPSATAAASQADLVAGLTQAEQAASDRLLAELPGLPPSLAQLLASIAAAEATHVPFLQAAAA